MASVAAIHLAILGADSAARAAVAVAAAATT